MQPFYETREERFFIGGMTHSPYPVHVHEVVELVCVLRGECVMQLDGAAYTLRKGDIAAAFPLVPHGYERMSPDIDGLAAFFPYDTINEFANVFAAMLPANPVLRAGQIGPDARLAIARLAEMPNEARFPLRLAFLHLLLADVLGSMALKSAGTPEERDMTCRAIKYIYDHASEDLTLTVVSRELGISQSHLSHLFSQRLRVNFRRFINAIRIDRATAMMRDPQMTLTAVCGRCGFENMRTFRRAFLRETGKLPNAYLKALREGE